MMRGELIAWSYTIALLEAMFTVREELVAKKSLAALHAGYANALTSKHGVVRKPALCGDDPFYCEHSYNCFTEYSPKYTEKFTLKELVVKTNTPTNWTFIDNAFLNQFHSDRIALQDKESRNYYVTHEGPTAGELFLRVNIISQQVGSALVCWVHIEKKRNVVQVEYRFDFNVGEEALSPDYIYVPKANRSAWTSKVEMYPCIFLNNLPVGVHVLGLAPKGKHAGVSHVVTWGRRDNSEK